MEWNTSGNMAWATLKGGFGHDDWYLATIETGDVTIDEHGLPSAQSTWTIEYSTRVDGRVNRITIISGTSETIHGAADDMLKGAIKCRVITLQEYEEITGLRSAS